MRFYCFIFGLLAIQFMPVPTVVNGQEARDSCNSTLPLNDLAFNSSLLLCVEAWSPQNYILRFARTAENTWNFILSTPESRAYIGIGFSTNGQMIGSSAVVGWIPDGGSGEAKQYSLMGKTSSTVTPDQGDLIIVNGSLKIESVSSRFYLSFQLTAELPRQRLIYALGPDGVFPSSPDFRLRFHRSATSTTINYNVTGGGPTTPEPAMSPSPAKSPSAPSPPSPPPKPSHALSSAYGLSRCLLFFGIFLVTLSFY